MSDSLLLNPAEVRARHILAYVFRFGADFPLHIASLGRELAAALRLDVAGLDRTPESLDLLDAALRAYGSGRVVIDRLFPHLVAYVGEVLIERNGGSWYMIWRPEYMVWEPYVVTDAGEFLDPFTRLYDQLHELDRGYPLQTAIGLMTEDAGL